MLQQTPTELFDRLSQQDTSYTQCLFTRFPSTLCGKCWSSIKH